MKKLMIAAVVAAMGVSAMADCEEAFCAYAYRVKLAGKTVKGKTATDYSKKVKIGESDCDYASYCFAKPASLRIAGYIYGVGAQPDECESCACNTLTGNLCHFWDENKVQAFKEVTTVDFEVYDILRNGGALNKAQIGFKIGDLYLAGFGAYNPDTLRLKSASGFFAGTMAAPECAGKYNEKTCEWGEATPAMVVKPCTEEWVAAEKAIAYGRWSATYKADKVATIEATGKNDCLYPAAFEGEKVPLQ